MQSPPEKLVVLEIVVKRNQLGTLLDHHITGPGRYFTIKKSADGDMVKAHEVGRGATLQLSAEVIRPFTGKLMKSVDISDARLVEDLAKADSFGAVASSHSAIAKSGVDSGSGYAKFITDFFESETFRLHGLSGFDRPVQRKVLHSVLRLCRDAEICGAVVKLIPIYVVDILRAQNLSAESVFGDQSVLKKFLSVDGNGSISTAVGIANALVVGVANVTAKRRLSSLGVLGTPEKCGSASEANKPDLTMSVHAESLTEKGNFVKPSGNRGTWSKTDADITKSDAVDGR